MAPDWHHSGTAPLQGLEEAREAHEGEVEMRRVYEVTSLMEAVKQAMADAGPGWLRTTHIRLPEERRSLLVADTDPRMPVPRRSDGRWAEE